MTNEEQKQDTPEGAQSEELSSTDLLALVRFLCSYQTQLQKLRYELLAIEDGEQLRDAMIGQWPVVQGLRNQMALEKIGRGEIDWDAVSRAVKSVTS